MKIVYLAHPLSGDWEANIADTRLWVRAALDAGYFPCAPYLMTEGVLHDSTDRELGMAFDLALLSRCDAVWLCGERISAGMQQECDEAERLGIPVIQLFRLEEVELLDFPG
jgi:hypothetical protein